MHQLAKVQYEPAGLNVVLYVAVVLLSIERTTCAHRLVMHLPHCTVALIIASAR